MLNPTSLHSDAPQLFSSAEPRSPAESWERESNKRALDELFHLTTQYRSGERFAELLRFVSRFRRYSPFNAMLIHIQKPGSVYVSPPSRWRRDYGRSIKPNAQPVVILQPMGPVMFVFDVSDTEGEPLPPKFEKPLEVRDGKVGSELDRLIENAKRDGVRVLMAKHGSHRGGSIGETETTGQRVFIDDKRDVPLRYELLLSEHLSKASRFATLVHELGHLYCGHLGTPNSKWWPDRQGLRKEVREFEAESVAYLVCKRNGIETTSDEYLSGYLTSGRDVPPISFERVMTSAGLIESMAHRKLGLRKAAGER